MLRSLLVVGLFSLSIATARAANAPEYVDPATEPGLVEKLVRKLGRDVPATEAPDLTRELTEIFDRLAKAQADSLPAGYQLVRNLHIIDTPEENAFVMTRKYGADHGAIHAFVTRGILRKMLYAADGTLDPLGWTRMAGVLAHEMGHPIDKIDGYGIESGDRHASQAIEVRADLEGTKLAERAGYPIQSVLWGLERLFEGRPKGQGLLAEGISSHPQNDLRTSTLRLFLTRDAYENGGVLAGERPAISSKALGELARMPRNDDFVPARGLTEILGRLKALNDDPRGLELRRRDFGQLVTALDDELRRLGTHLTPDESRGVIDFYRSVAERAFLRMTEVGREESHDELDRIPLEVWGKHYRALESVPFYRTARYLENVGAPFDRAFEIDTDGHRLSSWLPKMSFFFSPNDQVHRFEGLLVPAFKKNMTANKWYVQAQFEEPGQKTPLNPLQSPRWRAFVYDKVWPQLTPEEQHRFMFRDSDFAWHLMPEVSTFSAKDGGTGITQLRPIFADNPLEAEHYGRVKSFYENLWARRGELATQDMFRSNHIDWDTILAVVGIPRDEGYSRIRSAIQAYTRSPAYAEFLDWYQTTVPTLDNVKIKGSALWGADGKYISNGAFYKLLAGESNPVLKDRPDLRNMVAEKILPGFFENHKRYHEQEYRRLLRAELAKVNATTLDVPGLAAIHRSILKKMPLQRDWFYGEPVAAGLKAAGVPEAARHNLLREIFLTFHSGSDYIAGLYSNPDRDAFWISSDGENRSAFQLLRDEGLVKDAIDMFDQITLASGRWRRDIPEEMRLELEMYQGWVTSWQATVALNPGNPVYLAKLHEQEARVSEAQRKIALELTRPFPPERWIQLATAYDDDLKVALKNRLAAAPSDTARLEVLTKFATDYLDPARGNYEFVRAQNNNRFRKLKDSAVTALTELRGEPPQLLAAFRAVTGTGPTQLSDNYFERTLWPAVKTSPIDARENLESLLLAKRIGEPNLAMRVAAEVLEKDVTTLLTVKPVSEEKLKAFVQRLDALVPGVSREKDRFLESFAWRASIGEPLLSKYIQSAKATNWRNTSPYWVNGASVVSEAMGNATGEMRHDLLDYFRAPEGKNVPSSVLDAIRAERDRAMGISSRGRGSALAQTLRAGSEEQVERLKYSLEGILARSTPDERIPLLELAMTSGEHAIAKDANYEIELGRRYLGYKPASTQEKMLAAFLRTVPAEQKAASLAYLMSRSGDQRGSITALCEVFQTVGIKFCQMASIWNLFGDEFSKEAAALKHDAEPLEKAQILKIFDETLSPQERALIRNPVRVLGSASLKCVVEVELTDGRHVAALVQRPNAPRQIPYNLDLSRRFLENLKKEGVEIAGGMLTNLVDSFGEQLADETDMVHEAKLQDATRERYVKLNERFKDDLKGWRFEAPPMLTEIAPRKNLSFMTLAKGKTLAKTPAEVRAEIGTPIVKAALADLFGNGYFNADLHGGNYMVDPTTKTIYLLDPGQTERYGASKLPWAADEQYVLASFLKGLGQGNASEVTRAADQMVRPGVAKVVGAPRAALQSKLQKLFKEPNLNPSDRVIRTVTTLEDAGYKFKTKYDFGAMKGLMILQGEHYVPDAEFNRIITGEIRGKVIQKAPLLIRDATLDARDRCQQALDGFLQTLRK